MAIILFVQKFSFMCDLLLLCKKLMCTSTASSNFSSRMKLRKIEFVICIQSMLGFVTLLCSGMPSATVREL